ncbi:MAG: hypothetical protein ACLQQ4_06210, partial [Bacteroidia bacterium]
MKFLKLYFLPDSLLLVTALLCAVISCKNQKTGKVTPTQISLVQLLTGDGSAQFRHVSLGMDAKTVTGSEKKTPDEKDTNYVFYSLPMDTLYPDSINETADTMNYFTVAYNFDQQKLTEIDEDIFLANDSAAAALKLKLSDYFTSKYGDGITESDNIIWKLKKIDGKTAKVSLSDESEEYNCGKLSLVYYLE